MIATSRLLNKEAPEANSAIEPSSSSNNESIHHHSNQNENANSVPQQPKACYSFVLNFHGESCIIYGGDVLIDGDRYLQDLRKISI
ncbi:hypothetical protein V6Z12_D11G005400 [Gossypium hirsutum]